MQQFKIIWKAFCCFVLKEKWKTVEKISIVFIVVATALLLSILSPLWHECWRPFCYNCMWWLWVLYMFNWWLLRVRLSAGVFRIRPKLKSLLRQIFPLRRCVNYLSFLLIFTVWTFQLNRIGSYRYDSKTYRNDPTEIFVVFDAVLSRTALCINNSLKQVWRCSYKLGFSTKMHYFWRYAATQRE